MKINAENVTVGMGLKTFFGTHTVVKIEPYKGYFEGYVLNILVFSNCSKMSNIKGHIYEAFS